MVNPTLSPAAPAAPPHTVSETIDHRQVETALRTIRTGDQISNQSALANALDNPLLNQAERDLIIQMLLEGDDHDLELFYANDIDRSWRGDDPTLAADQQIIGEALQQAFEDGIIDTDDLLKIADRNGTGNGAQRLLDTLQHGGSGPNGTVEALSDALWERNGNDGLDRAGATLGYMSSPDLQARNLNTTELRREAFESLVAFNDAESYQDFPIDSISDQWQSSALAAAGSLFVNNSTELVDYYTGANGGTVQTEVLAQFMGQTVFNPDASSIVLDRQRDLVPAIQSAIGGQADRFMSAAAETTDPAEQAELIRQFGRLNASISVGAALALDNYSDQILANEASKQEFASMVGALIGKTPVSKVPGSGMIVDEVAGAIYDAITTAPERPDQAMAGVINDVFLDQVRALAGDLDNATLVDSFTAARADERTELYSNLNVNPGGHKE